MKTIMASLAGALMLAFGAPALADTYLIVINATPGEIQVNGQAVAPKAGAWSALDAVVAAPGGKYTIKDMHKRCSDGWSIEATGPTPASTCIHLNFGEIGCLFTAVESKGGGPARIEFTKVALGNCSNAWYQANKETISTIANQIVSAGATLVSAVATAAPK